MTVTPPVAALRDPPSDAPLPSPRPQEAGSSALAFPFPDLPAPGRSLEVGPGIRWLRMPLPFALDHINLWLMADGERWTQVDTGYGDAATRELWAAHFTSALAGRPLDRIVVTHCHPDHIGNAAWLANHFSCPILMPQGEFFTAHAMAHQHSGHGVARTLELFRAHGAAAADLEQLAARGNAYSRGVPELPWSFTSIGADDVLTIDERAWRIVPGFGHSPEHAALFCLEAAVLISGDMLLPRISTNVSVNPSEPDGDPLGRFLASLERFAVLPAQTLVLPSHGLPFRGIRPRVDALKAHHAARLREIEAAIGTERCASATAAELVPVLFRRALDVHQRFFAMGEAIAHLNYLWHSGRLDRRVAEDGTIRFTSKTS